MKKLLIVALVTAFASAPAMADGWYRSKPCKKENCMVRKTGHVIGDTLEFVFKLPFRLVSSTAEGVYDLAVDQSFKGFADGYNRF